MTELRDIVRHLLADESDIGEMVAHWWQGILQAWEIHQKSSKPTAEAWATVWKEERQQYQGFRLAPDVRCQVIVHLADNGMSHRSIAAALGVSLGTVNTYASETEQNCSVGADGKTRNTENIGKGQKKAGTKTSAATNRRRAKKASEIFESIIPRGPYKEALYRVVRAAHEVSRANGKDITKLIALAQTLADLAAEMNKDADEAVAA